MTKKTISFFCTLLLSGLTSIFAQEEIKVEQYQCSKLIPVKNPVLIDSTNLKKSTFERKDFLQTVVDFDLIRNSNQVLTATDGVAILEYAKDKAVQLLMFNIDVTDYTKAKLKLTSTEMFELYINGKKEKTKETKEDSLSRVNTITLDLTMEPGRHEVIIKRFALYKNFNQSEIKTIIAPESKTAAPLQVSIGTKRNITINDMIEGRRVIGTSISPSGNYYMVTYEEVFNGGERTETCEICTWKDNRVVYRFPSSIRAYWMPASDQVYYWRKGQAEQNFFVMDLAALEEKKLANEIKINSVRVSPDEKYMIVHQREDIQEDKKDLKRHLSPSDRAGGFRLRNSMFYYSFEKKTLERLSYGSTNTYLADIRNDGQKLLFFSQKENLLQPPTLSDQYLFQLDIETWAVDTLSNDPFISDASYSPDGKQILITGSGNAFDNIGLNIAPGQISNSYDNQAFIMDLKSKKITALTKDFNPSISGMAWSENDNLIYVTAEDGDKVLIYSCNPSSGAFEKLNLKEEMIRNFSLSKSSTHAMYRGSGVANSSRLYSYDTRSKTSTLISDPYKQQLDEIQLGQVNDWKFTASDGTVIQGRYYLPPGFDANKKYPMIVYYYGGTSPTSRTFESRYPLQVYAALGYVVYTLQPSGTTGFGQEFSARHVNAWGKYTADEIIEGTQQFCRSHAYVDSAKIACIGASYGGFMTQYLLTRTDLFAAAVSHAGISALSSYWGEGYWGYTYSQVASAGSYPWNNPELYVEQSPLFHADKINTPLLLLHGGADTNVPVGESIQMYNALKLLGKEVEFIEVSGENHAISAYKKRLDWNRTIFAWFAKWLKDQPEWWNVMYGEN